MRTKIVEIDPLNMDTQKLIKAAELLEKGKIIAFPTDTVYGIGADAFNASAIRKIYKIKERPFTQPINVLIYAESQLNLLSTNIDEKTQTLINTFWPGALTIIIEKKDNVPSTLTSHKKTIGVRMPDNLIVLKLIELMNKPLAATSANISGKKSPVSALDVLDQLGGKISLLIDGGTTLEKLDSTILDMTVSPPMILREGSISQVEIEQVLHENIDS